MTEADLGIDVSKTLGMHAPGNWSEQLLRNLYFLTWQHAAAFPSETERLWRTVAASKRNVIPILDFLITRGLQEASEPHLQVPGSSASTEVKIFCQ